MIIIETHIFTEAIQEIMDDSEYAELQESLIANPKSGKVIRGSAGLRKIRWGLTGTGKRGGVRIIYYYLDKNKQIYMIYVYKKNERSDLTKEQLKRLKQVVKEEIK